MPKPRPDALDRPWVPKLIRWMSQANVWAYRKSGGRIAGTFLGGAPVGLLTTTGKQSGKPRVAPLLFLRDGDRVVLVASQGGQRNNPLWFGNLTAKPDVSFQIGTKRSEYRARTANDAERAVLWPRLTKMYPGYDDYQSWTDRVIPIVILEPLGREG